MLSTPFVITRLILSSVVKVCSLKHNRLLYTWSSLALVSFTSEGALHAGHFMVWVLSCHVGTP